MEIRENVSLRQYNTFGINAIARYFSSFGTTEELVELLDRNSGRKKIILGGGSNVLLMGDVDGVVLKNELRGIEVVKEEDDFVYVRAAAGERWHSFVQYCVQRNWGGLENLSLIPGSVGAAPMQNIGAYGVELQDVFESLTAFHLQDKRMQVFKREDCVFGYRESVFKKQYREQFVILDVTVRLSKRMAFHTSYGAIRQELEKMGVKDLSIEAISRAVIRIRTAKLPDPVVIGNAGSFFKNPEISVAQFKSLEARYPDMPHYPVKKYAAADPSREERVKIAAGWLIEQCGWKGFRRGDAGVHINQALVLVNYGNAKGSDIYQLSEEILQSVNNKFGILLEREVNIV